MITKTASPIGVPSGKPRFLIFSLHGYIPQFTIAECTIGDVLFKNGADVTMVRPIECACRLLERFNHRDIDLTPCPQCADESRIVRLSTPGWHHEVLNNLARPEDSSWVEEQLRSLDINDVTSFVADQLPFGRIALYDLLIKHKKSEMVFQPDEPAWKECQATIRACLFSVRWLRRHFEAHGRPDGIVVYNSNYSLNRAAMFLGESLGIPTYSIHNGFSLKTVWDTLLLTKGNIDERQHALPPNWQQGYADRVMHPADVRYVGEHFDELFSGKKPHAYSSPLGSSPAKDLINKVNPNGDRRILLATTSSPDEWFANIQSGIRPEFPPEAYLFPDQNDWLKFLIKKTATDPSIALIIRVHPREFPNKREGVVSGNSRRLKSLLSDLPENVLVNWPQDNVSFYDLIPAIDLMVSAWSTTLLEASLFGCPIVFPKNPTPGYQCVADAVPVTTEDYWAAITKHIREPWQWSRAIETFRWFWLYQTGSLLSLESSQKRRISGLRETLEYAWRDFCALAARAGFLKTQHQRHKKTYWGDPRLVSQRRINVRAEPVIRETLLGHFNPLESFDAMQQLQNNPGAMATGSDNDAAQELAAVQEELRRLLEIILPQRNAESGRMASLIRPS